MPHHNIEADHKLDIYKLLHKVAESGTPTEIEWDGKHFLISPSGKKCLDCLENHPDFIVGDPEELVHIDWSPEWETEP
ncbi:MAG: type II toxin-antitoxin system Phd/YefM family antitoxin [Desulfobacteraceae bacterium]|nr:type II toxin-antitoxin system Phd/YefM family antitoxin [Desulfobacteraceae bacterium]